jgi:formylglycine-generating enzyme required for sulfatase activity
LKPQGQTSIDETLAHAEQLYLQVKSLNTEPLNTGTASLIIELVDDAIKEFGTTSHDKKVELRTIRAEAEKVVPPDTVETLRKRAEGIVLRIIYPRNKRFRNIVLLILGVGVLSVPPSFYVMEKLRTAQPQNSTRSIETEAPGINKKPEAESTIAPSATSGVNSEPGTIQNKYKMEFVLIPPGKFRMGSESGQTNTRPVRWVTIRQPFYLGKTEVTQEQWTAVMGKGNNPSHFRGLEKLPVEEVSWEDAQVFINKLNQLDDGFEYRLPTEAEWEYSCRAESKDEIEEDLDNKAWYWNNSSDSFWSAEKNHRGTHPVASKLPNRFGLYDMNGNVWEWCRDGDHRNFDGAPSDGTAWIADSRLNLRVLRGGSWGSDIDHGLHYAYRNFIAPDSYHNDYAVGFRVAANRTK